MAVYTSDYLYMSQIGTTESYPNLSKRNQQRLVLFRLNPIKNVGGASTLEANTHARKG